MEFGIARTVFRMTLPDLKSHSDHRGSRGYGGIAIALHWLTAAIVLVAITLGLIGASVKGVNGDAVTEIHKPLGFLVLVLTLVRLAWRAGHRPPPLPSTVSSLQKFTARAVQVGLYLLLLVMPISGWWMTSAFHKHPINLFGLFEVPFLPIEPAMPSAIAAHQVHETMGWTIIMLIGLHAAAALKHHYVDKDHVLSAILGKWSWPPTDKA